MLLRELFIKLTCVLITAELQENLECLKEAKASKALWSGLALKAAIENTPHKNQKLEQYSLY